MQHQVVTYASDWLYVRDSHDRPLRFYEFSRVAHGTQENILLTRENILHAPNSGFANRDHAHATDAHFSDLQSYSFSKAHLLASVFKVLGRGLGRSPQTCPTWRKKMLGLAGNKAIPTMLAKLSTSTAECCGCSFLCEPAALINDQSTVWTLQGCPPWGTDLLCNLRHPSLCSDLVTSSANQSEFQRLVNEGI